MASPERDSTLVRKTVGATFRRTVKPAYTGARDLLSHLLFERRSGIRTSEVVRLEDLGLAGEDRWYYAPSGWLALRRIMPRREVSRDDVFIDLGSGMGRAVYQAARYPFKRVIGVELSKELNDIAIENLEHASGRLVCKDVELVNSDVLDYEIPDDVTVVYLANPFTGTIFSRVIDMLKESLERSPRLLRIIYVNPLEEYILLGKGAKLVRKVRGLRPSREWSRSNAIRLYTLSPGRDAER